MVDSGSNIGSQHPKEVEDDAPSRPVIVTAEAPYQEKNTNGHTKEDTSCM